VPRCSVPRPRGPRMHGQTSISPCASRTSTAPMSCSVERTRCMRSTAQCITWTCSGVRRCIEFLAGEHPADRPIVWAPGRFAAAGPKFALLFGEPASAPLPDDQGAQELVGEAWLYLLHVRSSIERSRPWQAQYMVAGVRERILELACRRHGLPAGEARGVDDLPDELLGTLASTLSASLDPPILRRVLRAAIAALGVEIAYVERDLAHRLGSTLRALGTA
jgi:hypothetical protein